MCFPQAVREEERFGTPFTRNFPPEEYKGHLQNWEAIQDSKGVLYFGNSNSIQELDEQQWE